MKHPYITQPIHYWGMQGERTFGEHQPMAAVVIFVHGPASVDLKITDHAGFEHLRKSVWYRAPKPDDRRNGEFYCTPVVLPGE